MKQICAVLTLSVLLLLPLQASQDGIIVREAAVYSAAKSSAARVGKIPAGNRVSIFGRKGGWKEIYSETRAITGWVRSYQVREGNFEASAGNAVETDSRGFLSGLAALSRKASGFFSSGSGSTSSGTATIGVRGLSEDQIKTAVADFKEFEKMKSFGSNSKRLKQFASQGQLQARKLPHL